MAVIHIESIEKKYEIKDSSTAVLLNVHLRVQPGEQISIIGRSGSGKSTLLHIIGGLIKPTSGSVCWHGQNIWRLPQRVRTQQRNRQIGFVYQSHNLLEEFTALENTAFPLLIRGLSQKESQERAREWLHSVGLDHRCHHTPKQLSGGERQRVAVARALSALPACLLADEPTGHLDKKTAQQIFELLKKLSIDHHLSLVVVTHNNALAQQLSTRYTLTQGILLRDA